MKLFTLSCGDYLNGVVVDSYQLSPVLTIPAVITGEEGRNRKQAVLPVELKGDALARWDQKGKTRIKYGRLEKNSRGHNILVQTNEPESGEECLVVFLTPIGHRGNNSHIVEGGTIVMSGKIAQGDAGRMAEGYQPIAVVSANFVFKERYWADHRHRPDPGGSWCYYFDGERMHAISEKNRRLVDEW